MPPVRAWRFDEKGRKVLRGFRAHCEDCGLLSEPLTYRAAAGRLETHRPKCPAKEVPCTA